jgi:CRISPR/Cas system-associated exonuclease Cas4 (RecB family)
MPTKPAPKKCAGCDYRGMCSEGAKAAAKAKDA